jgi:hypothetical protein
MNLAKLSLSTRMAMDNNFGFPKGENGVIGAFVKVSKNIDKELKDLGASIQGLMQGRTTGEFFSIRFPINSLDKISEIDGLVYLDTGEKVSSEPVRIQQFNNNSLQQQKQKQKQTKQLLFILGALVIGYYTYKEFNK